MPDYTLVIGNRNYSSWSLRAWLVLKQTAADFDEVVIPLDHPESKAAILSHSAAGRVPVLKCADGTVWESLAIAEYLAETFPEAGLWPAPAAARARARAISSEMHAGFVELRTHMPMDVRAEWPGRGQLGGVDADIARIVDIWSQCRAAFGDDGPFLFGRFTIADAMFAPVVSRFRTYAVDLAGSAADYAEAVWRHRPMAAWRAAAAEEPWVIDTPKI